MSLSRRHLLIGAAGLASTTVGWSAAAVLRQPEARVLRKRCLSYEEDLVGHVRDALDAFPQTRARVKGARVVLKPNFVEVHADRPINTDPRLIVAAAAVFLEAGAASVTVAEGPGHTRDSEAILEQTGLEDRMKPLKVGYVDLNVDEPTLAPLPRDFTDLGKLPIARTILQADLVVSMPKLKTHHWAGVTLSMKNLFGTVPGRAFGWPKNPLHWAGIDNSIADLWSVIQPGFVIIDGVVGMEGDGPIMGTPVQHGVLLFGEQAPAVDAEAARLMGIRPERVRSLVLASRAGGTISPLRIERIGDDVPVKAYQLLPEWSKLRA